MEPLLGSFSYCRCGRVYIFRNRSRQADAAQAQLVERSIGHHTSKRLLGMRPVNFIALWHSNTVSPLFYNMADGLSFPRLGARAIRWTTLDYGHCPRSMDSERCMERHATSRVTYPTVEAR